MAAVSLPELPETSRTGTPGFPELPAPPLGGGRNGKDERDGMALDLFGLQRCPGFTDHDPAPARCDGLSSAGVKDVHEPQ